ncbi:hypothetical protein LZ554_000190 [Drepanopeziza brunnea f. sp. 'monogermtubi']|nr:hypothetical protein LZ554_000190 [Drepanopeziza brunnea f. sp. 'monogermtubi']
MHLEAQISGPGKALPRMILPKDVPRRREKLPSWLGDRHHRGLPQAILLSAESRQFARHCQARSGHYVVLKNDSGYDGKLLQEVINILCSMGSPANHALSVCTPARYADSLCDRLR